jgi:hypothetical protein
MFEVTPPSSNGNSARLKSAFRASPYYVNEPKALRSSIIANYESLMTDGKGFSDKDIDDAKAEWGLNPPQGIQEYTLAYDGAPAINTSFEEITKGGDKGNPASQWVPNTSSPEGIIGENSYASSTNPADQQKMLPGYGTEPKDTPFVGAGSALDPSQARQKTIGKALQNFGKLGKLTND